MVLEFDHISKLYSLGKIGTGTLSRDLSRWWQMAVLKKEDPYMKIGQPNKHSVKSDTGFVWALRDISFSVNQGDVVGIIGKNGSGKSTLLKILSRITAPTTGEIRTKGRIASLLEVGTGFHDDLTGRENIYMNGAILGMTKQEINSKLDEIVDFSGIEKYIDTPVKRYSSGMKVRLGFAVAAFLEPEILLVDEVLAVGDAEFQKKAIGKMQSVSTDEGRTVLFVSHNMNSMLQLCNRGIILNEGQCIFNGNVVDAVNQYLTHDSSDSNFEGIDGIEEEIYIRKASVKNENGLSGIYSNTEPVYIEFEVVIKKKLPALVIGFNLFSQYDYPIARADFNDVNKEYSLKPGEYSFKFEIPAKTLAPGNYKIVFDISQTKSTKRSTDKSNLYFDIIQGAGQFGRQFSNVRPLFNSLIRADWLKSITRIS